MNQYLYTMYIDKSKVTNNIKIGIQYKGNVIQYFVTQVWDIIFIILTKNQIP